MFQLGNVHKPMKNLSLIGQQMSQLTGVRAIMKDIIETLRSGGDASWIDLSAGNPVILPEVEQLWREQAQKIIDSPDFGPIIARYGSSQGYEPMIEAVVSFFSQRYSLSLGPENVLITPGSQSIYFFAANSFAGPMAGGGMKKVLLPLSPDYTGYGGVALNPDSVWAVKPFIEKTTAHRFKYRPDFSQLTLDESIGCIIFSRPSNPTGNVLTDSEVQKIADLAAVYDIPVLVDSAYAPPFPALNYVPMEPNFSPNVLHCLSLSKAGLPGERLGVVIGDAKYINVLQAFQTNACVHSSRFGQAIAAPTIRSGALAEMAQEVINPHYGEKFKVITSAFFRYCPDAVPWYLHETEGGIFAWLWLENLPITDVDLYQLLKKSGVIVVPGSSFFPGLREDWKHKHECVRISLTATPKELEEGVRRIAQVIIQVYQDSAG